MGREDQFSFDGKDALWQYLEECDNSIELDIVALCCEYTEYRDFEHFMEEYDIHTMDDLEDRTTVIHIPDSEHFIIQNF